MTTAWPWCSSVGLRRRHLYGKSLVVPQSSWTYHIGGQTGWLCSSTIAWRGIRSYSSPLDTLCVVDTQLQAIAFSWTMFTAFELPCRFTWGQTKGAATWFRQRLNLSLELHSNLKSWCLFMFSFKSQRINKMWGWWNPCTRCSPGLSTVFYCPAPAPAEAGEHFKGRDNCCNSTSCKHSTGTT